MNDLNSNQGEVPYGSSSNDPENQINNSLRTGEQPKKPVESMHDLDQERRKEEQNINLVNDDSQARSISNQPETSSIEFTAIPETWLTKVEADEMRTRWNAIQFQFVDSPCSAVEQGDTLVAEVIERITQTLSDLQNSLNKQWINHDDVSTEELRHTLQNYRSVLDRLLSL